MATGPGDQRAAGARGHGRFLASHTDRERVVETLKTAFVEGRLTMDELDARAGQAFAARTYADLAALTADLPAWSAGDRPRPGRHQARPPVSRRTIRLRLATCASILPAVMAIVILSNNDNVASTILPPLVLVYLMALLIGVSHLVGSRLEPRRSADPAGSSVMAEHRLASGASGLAHVFWQLEGVADCPPDGLSVCAVRESALDRTPAELVEHEVLGHALRIHVAELRVHPVPEFRQPHVAQGTADPGPDLRRMNLCWPVGLRAE